jgi:molybdenum cofactor cytidylyltransferase
MNDRSGRVAGVVLAAGRSTRMGQNKLLLEIDGEPLLARAVRCASDAGLDPVVVVVGHEADRVTQSLASRSCTVVLNPAYEAGPYTSLAAGFRAVGDDVDAAVVVLPDMPLVTAGMIVALRERYRASGAGIVVSDYDGVEAPPTLYDRALFEELRAAERGCGRRIVARHREQVVSVAWPADALTDLDRPEDIDRVRALGGSRIEGITRAS